MNHFKLLEAVTAIQFTINWDLLFWIHPSRCRRNITKTDFEENFCKFYFANDDELYNWCSGEIELQSDVARVGRIGLLYEIGDFVELCASKAPELTWLKCSKPAQTSVPAIHYKTSLLGL